MRVIGLLSWFDEKPDHLAALVANLADHGISHMVAVDGAFALYPDARAASPVEQRDAIWDAASDARIGCTVYVPTVPWAGNEPEKRTAQFAIGHVVAEPGDWFVVLDADERIVQAGDYRQTLAGTWHECATVIHTEQGRPDLIDRRFYRYQPSGIEVRGTHFRFVTGDGRPLKGPGACEADVAPIVVEHHPEARTAERLRRREGYYAARLNSNFEHERGGLPEVA